MTSTLTPDSQLLQAFQAVHPAWKQKDIQAAIFTAQGHISAVSAGKKQFSRQTRALIRYKIQDRVAVICGDGFTYFEVQRVAQWFIRLHTEPEFFTAQAGAELVDDRAYQAALRIFSSGYLIM